MARICEVCGKIPQTGHNVSHSNRKTKRRFLPNLQTLKTFVGGQVIRKRLCTRCIRSGAIVRAPHARKTSFKPAEAKS